MKYRLGVDVGGTFTDLALFNEETGKIVIGKISSTPSSPNIAVAEGVKKLIKQEKVDPASITSFIHGTTVATNALLERKGARCALITTKGFKDVLHIGRQDRPHLYNFSIRRAKPLVPRYLRLEVKERVLHTGEVLKPINQEEIGEIIKKIGRNKVRSIAICLLHSYVNPEHEQKLKKAINDIYPNIAVCISSEILPEFREYERMSTTVINAYVVPMVNKYLRLLVENIKEIGIKSKLYVMASNGGIMSAEAASEKGAHLIMSGPAGGVIGAFKLSQKIGIDSIITVDMGGTSFDISLIYKGEVKLSTETEINRRPLKLPTIDIHTIGAGGGSIAWIDEGKALRVGPQSAGADPGPVCYNRGGTEPTVTDANLVLGRLNPDYFLGGEMKISKNKAYHAIKEKIADPLNISVEKAAEGIIHVVNANMIRGIRYVSVERGYDPREFCLVVFGGCGPLHAGELAQDLKIPKILVPLSPGVASARGLLMADFRRDYSHAYIKRLDEIDTNEINHIYKDMEHCGINEVIKEGISKERIEVLRSADMRYLGQGYELNVPVPGGQLNQVKLRQIKCSFDNLHEKSYGFKRDEDAEFVTFRVSVLGRVLTSEFKKLSPYPNSLDKAFKCFRQVFIAGNYVNTPVYNRDKLGSGCNIKGPAIVEQKDSTTIFFLNQIAEVDNYGNLLITLLKEE